eukprot:scaffold88271_cov65-Phaeocystis_antarctica.AAC.1
MRTQRGRTQRRRAISTKSGTRSTRVPVRRHRLLCAISTPELSVSSSTASAESQREAGVQKRARSIVSVIAAALPTASQSFAQ